MYTAEIPISFEHTNNSNSLNIVAGFDFMFKINTLARVSERIDIKIS